MLESYRNSHNSVMKHIYLVSAKEKIPKHNLYIFGHSLDITDRDVLRLFTVSYTHLDVYKRQ